MRKIRWFGDRPNEKSELASIETFASVFESERAGLQRLALLLTSNQGAAKRCLTRAFRECVAGNPIHKEWVLSWARRVVIRNAISLVMGSGDQSFINKDDDANNGSITFLPDDSSEAISEYKSILELPDDERFIFVICILERYSLQDCALLLGKPPTEINETRKRIGYQMGQTREPSDRSQDFVSY